MNLDVRCKSCRKEIRIKEKASARQDLIPSIGEYFFRKCDNCGVQREYHVNDVKASQSFSSNLIFTFLGLSIIGIVSLFFWNMGLITNIGLIIGGGIIFTGNSNLATSNAGAFNKYRIKATIKDD